MRNVQLPDPLYDEAAQVALRRGLSLDNFIADAVRQSLDDLEVPYSFFTPEIMAGIDEAAHQARQGKGMTMKEVRRSLARRQDDALGTKP